MGSSLYAGQLLFLPMLAATSYCSTAAVCCPENLRIVSLHQAADCCPCGLCIQLWHDLQSRQRSAHRDISKSSQQSILLATVA